MKILTGYYAKLAWYQKQDFFEGYTPIAISAKVPPGWKYSVYPKFAPSFSIWKEWHDSVSPDKDRRFTDRYEKEIVGLLSPDAVFSELSAIGDSLCLFCYLRPEAFCHRHLAARWLLKHFGIAASEISIPDAKNR